MLDMHKKISGMGETVDEVIKTTDSYIEPIRKNGFKRFPTIFMLLATFGAVATFLGIERIILESDWLNESPFSILAVGIVILVFTGRLYKKLS